MQAQTIVLHVMICFTVLSFWQIQKVLKHSWNVKETLNLCAIMYSSERNTFRYTLSLFVIVTPFIQIMTFPLF